MMFLLRNECVRIQAVFCALFCSAMLALVACVPPAYSAEFVFSGGTEGTITTDPPSSISGTYSFSATGPESQTLTAISNGLSFFGQSRDKIWDLNADFLTNISVPGFRYKLTIEGDNGTERGFGSFFDLYTFTYPDATGVGTIEDALDQLTTEAVMIGQTSFLQRRTTDPVPPGLPMAFCRDFSDSSGAIPNNCLRWRSSSPAISGNAMVNLNARNGRNREGFLFTITSEADIRVSKTVNDPQLSPGARSFYEITVAHLGDDQQSAAIDLHIVDLLPAGITAGTPIFTNTGGFDGNPRFADGVLVIDVLDFGQTLTMKLPFTVNADVMPGATITNTTNPSSITMVQTDPVDNHGPLTASFRVDDGVVDVSKAVEAAMTRFGRTVGEQSVSAVRDRITTDRGRGFTGSFVGHALPEVICDYDKAAPKHIREDDDWRRNCVRQDGYEPGSDKHADTVGDGDEVRAINPDEILPGTSFTLKQETENGASLALWGRGAVSEFSGREGDLNIAGDVRSVMLGSDWARGDWLFGLMLSRSLGDIEYRYDQAGTARGELDADLTALIPYAGWDVNERLSAWGTVGVGRGATTVRPHNAVPLTTDIDWRMAAAGLEGALLPHAVLGSATLDWSADALWTQTRVDAVAGRLQSLSGETTRLRFGLRSSWERRQALGGNLVPKFELGLRHDGGDAETGFGLEIGGGLDWRNPARGLALGLSGRTLALHEDGDFGNWGLSVDLDYDPTPETKRGFKARLSHHLGGASSGGVQELLGPDLFPGLNKTTGESRWNVEAAYGVSRGRGRVGSPYMALRGTSGVEADTRFGYRLEPDAPHSPNLNVDLWAEPAAQTSGPASETNHELGVDFNWNW